MTLRRTAIGRVAIAVGAAVLIVIAVVGVIELTPQPSTGVGGDTTAQPCGTPGVAACASSYPYASCLMLVPYSANITGGGTGVMFSNGTKISFPVSSCLSAVYGDQYSVVLNVTANPAFVAAENGAQYAFDENSYLGNFEYSATSGTVTCSSNSYTDGNTTVYGCFESTQLLFSLTSSNQTVSGCGITEPKTLGEIEVSVPLSSSLVMDLAHISVSQIPASELNIFTCTTTTTYQ